MSGRCTLFTASLLGVAVTVASRVFADEAAIDFLEVARSGARLEECGGGARTPLTRWDRARVPHLGEYCAVLARGYASLRGAPEVALEAATAADRLLPDRAGSITLAARAKVALGAFAEAWSLFERLKSLPSRALESPGALHDLAVAATRTDHPDAALDAYRALIPRVALIDDGGEVSRIFVEGGVVAMGRGPEHLPEAVGYLTEGRRRGPLLGSTDYLLGALALAQSRLGRASEASAVSSDASGPWQLEAARARAGKSHVDEPALPGGELDAMIAILAEARDRELALTRWQSFLESDAGKNGPFAAHARAHREALLRGPSRVGRAPGAP